MFQVIIDTDKSKENNVDTAKLETNVKTEQKELSYLSETDENVELMNYDDIIIGNETGSKIIVKNEKRKKLKSNKRKITKENKNKNRFSCETCEKTFVKKTTLKDHILREHSSENVKENYCEKCNKSFSRKDNLKEHILRRHSNKEQYSCDICGMKFKSLYNYNKHDVVHGKKPFSCSYCGKQFRIKSKFLIHER